ncbi:hypothetical protein COOONC_03396 [Cooperia oncophora]
MNTLPLLCLLFVAQQCYSQYLYYYYPVANTPLYYYPTTALLQPTTVNPNDVQQQQQLYYNPGANQQPIQQGQPQYSQTYPGQQYDQSLQYPQQQQQLQYYTPQQVLQGQQQVYTQQGVGPAQPGQQTTSLSTNSANNGRK